MNFRYEDIISYLKCGYTDIKEDDLNDFESYMYRWNIYGKKFKNVRNSLVLSLRLGFFMYLYGLKCLSCACFKYFR